MSDSNEKLHGIVAYFADTDGLMAAARKVRDAANGVVMDLVVRQLTKEDHVVVAEQRKQKRSGFSHARKWIVEKDSD